MKIHLATDHAGFELKEKIKTFLNNKGYDVEDCGAYQYEELDDYPDFIAKAAEAVSKDPDNSKAIVFGGSGQGEAIVANKFKDVRCTVFYGPISKDSVAKRQDDPFEVVKLSRKHNDSNILSLGARFISEKDALKAIQLWLDTPFEDEERHVRRIEKIRKIESDH